MAAQVLGRNPVGLAAVHLDEKALYPIETQFQAGQAAAIALALFEVHQELLGVAAQGAQLIELSIVALGNHAAISKIVGRRVDNRAPQQFMLWVVIADLGGQFKQQRRLDGGRQRLLESGQGGKRGAQLRKIARPR